MKILATMSVLAAVSLLATGAGGATPLDARDGAIAGANRLLALQNEDGSFPWFVGDPGVYQNVQGITAIGLVDAYEVTADSAYLDAATLNRDWLANYRDTGCPTPPCLLSAPNIFFLAEYALLTLNSADLALARAALADRIAQYGSPEAVIEGVINGRVAQGHTNLGLWDAAFFVRAAQDAGEFDAADRMARTLELQTIVDPFDSAANWYEFGLAGIILGLAEGSGLSYQALLDQAEAALLVAQNETSGSFPVTYLGVVYPDDTQMTAYACMALVALGNPGAASLAADFVLSVQRVDGSFAPYLPDDASEYAEVDAEAVGCLAAVTAPVPQAAAAYLDVLRAQV